MSLVYNIHCGEVTVGGVGEEEMRRNFETAMTKMFTLPKVNEFQQEIYGSRLLVMSKKQLEDIVENNRGMGKTTAHALKQIAEAIQNPGKEVKLFNDANDSNACAKYYIRDHVQPIIDKLGLKYMVISHTLHTLKFDV